MDIITPLISLIFMIIAYHWGYREGKNKGILRGVSSLFWWFESKAGVQQVNMWIADEPDPNIKEHFINVNKYRRCSEVYGLVLNRSDDE